MEFLENKIYKKIENGFISEIEYIGKTSKGKLRFRNMHPAYRFLIYIYTKEQAQNLVMEL